MTEKLDRMMKPIIASNTPVQNRLAYGSSSVSGAAQAMDRKIMLRLPKRSDNGPPKKVPSAPAARNRKM
ncbi:hypothetical protein D1872_292760 [compost metagenome]